MIPLRFARGGSTVLRASFRTSRTTGGWRPTLARRSLRTQSMLRAEESKGQEWSKKREDRGIGLFNVGSFIGVFGAILVIIVLVEEVGKHDDSEERARRLLRARERFPLLALTLPEADKKLREEEDRTVKSAENPNGPVRPDGRVLLDTEYGKMKTVTYKNRVASNSPVEDRYSYKVFHAREGAVDTQKSKARRFEAWGVFDGHAGSAMSSILNDTLLSRLASTVQNLVKGSYETSKFPSSETAMITSIKATFTALDNTLLAKSMASLSLMEKNEPNALSEALHGLAPFYAGSCALVCLYDHNASKLYTACVGDSRAVLVRQKERGQYIAIPLSEDQTGFNPSEAKRVRDAHPGEHDCIDDKTGRVLGIAVTRAFGDHRFKLPLEAIKTMKDKFFGAAPRPGYKTPPYLTAEPEVTVTRIEPGDMVILASDGLWDHMSSDAAAECLGRWVTKYKGKGEVTASEKSSLPYNFSGEPDWQVESKYIVTEDENAATHLIRNTLGGNRRDLFTGIMSAMPPLSREAHDDITVQVVLF